MSKRVINFCAGPCTLPLEVLEEAQAEFVDYENSGMSLIEMSHRGKHYDAVHMQAMALMKEVYQVPDEFSVLFIQGGAHLQFAMVPMNLLNSGMKGAYTNTGTWGKGAITDGKQCGDVYTAWDGAENNYTRMPDASEIVLQDNTRYLHITSNETIGGIRFAQFPDVEVPLVIDMSSDYMSRAVPWEKFDLVYGGLQKNLGPAGLAVVFVRDSILERTNKDMARYLRYDIHKDKSSMFNTPAVFPIYMAGKVLKWMKAKGGLAVIEAEAAHKSSLIYKVIDSSDGYYRSPVDPTSRSHMNVVFRLQTEELEKQFLAESSAADLLNLKGHRSVGGLRASIYNAMPVEGVQVLANFMSDFMRKNG